MSLLEELQRERIKKEEKVKELQSILSTLQKELATLKISKEIKCSHCDSILKIIKYYLQTGNKHLPCPVCGVYIGDGIKVEIISSPIIDKLRSDIALLNKRIDELQRAITLLKEQIDALKRRILPL